MEQGRGESGSFKYVAYIIKKNLMGSIHLVDQCSTRGRYLRSEYSHSTTGKFARAANLHESGSDVLIFVILVSSNDASLYQAVMDSLLLVSVFQLASRIRQYVEKTACKIR